MRPALLLFGLGCCLASCTSPGENGRELDPRAADRAANGLPSYVDASNFTVLQPGLAGSGPPVLAEVSEMKQRGYSTIINLRLSGEPGVAEERAAAEAAGLNYVSIPLTGSNFALADAYLLRAALTDAPPGSVLLHCGSGARAGALWAMTCAVEQGLAPADAQALALRSGASPAQAERVAEQLRAAARL